MSEGTGNQGGKGVQRNVDYTLEIVDNVPEDTRAGGARVFDIAMAQIVEQYEKGEGIEDDGHTGKWRRIASYKVFSAASAAANVLRQRHGNVFAVEGWEFRTATHSTPDGERKALLARYDPTQIVQGAKAAWETSEKDRKAKLAAAKTERANGGTKAKDASAAPAAPKAKEAAPTH